MSTQGGWWDNPVNTEGDSPVIRHAPDSNNYHIPDQDMLSKMRGSLVGKFATIPSANKDGTSKGFDATVAGPVHVDPDAPDGGVIFDPASVQKNQINQAIMTSSFPHQAFYKLGTPAPLLGYGRGRVYNMQPQEVQRVNPIMPGAYVVAKAAQDGSQVDVSNGNTSLPPSMQDPVYQAQEEQQVNPVPPLMAQPVMQQPMQPQMQAVQPVYQPGPQYMPVMPQMDPNMLAMMQQLTATVQNLAGQVAQVRQQVNTPQHATTGVSQVPMPQGPPPGLATVPNAYRNNKQNSQDDYSDDTARPIRKMVRRDKNTNEIIEEDTPQTNSMVQQQARQTVSQYRKTQEEPEGLIVGFETLNLSFVTGPVANKAKRKVFFEIPNAGKHSASYHDVIESEQCVVLAYDTRYEDGTQYLPPDLAEQQIKLHVPSMKKTFQVSSMGFHFSFGVFDLVLLVKHDANSLDVES